MWYIFSEESIYQACLLRFRPIMMTTALSNHGEVEAAESRRDFVHKRRICLKELRETKRWLRLVSRVKKLGPPADLISHLNEVEELIRIFVASIRTAEKNAK
jgi:four helix bundle protein